jgi:hypothetical protein
MIKKITLSIALVGLCILAYNVTFKTVQSHMSGSPAKYTGSPADVNNCTSCHNPTATTVTGWITSNIPATGYTPGQIYTITATATDALADTFGFEISPQLTSGNPLGEKRGMMIVTSTTETVLVSTTGTSDNKYITHRAAGTNGTSHSKTWSFNWKGDTVNAKSVTFYGAFVAGTSPSSDHTYLSTLTRGVYSGGINDPVATAMGLVVYPNPSSTFTTVSLYNEKPATLNIQLYDLSGKLVNKLVSGEKFTGDYTKTFSLTQFNKGIYLLKVEIDGQCCYKKLVIS